MHDKRTATLLALALSALTLAAQTAPGAGANRINLKIASVAPSRSPWDIEQRSLAQEWSRITGGLVSVTFYDATSLGGEKAVIQKMRSVRPGQKAPLDGVIFTTIGLYELAPAASIYTLSVPFLIRSQDELNRVLAQFGPELVTEYRKAGYEMIAWTNVGWLSFYTKDPFSTLSELKKIKIASAGLDSPVLGNTFRSAGFTIEDMTADKLLQALKSAGGVRGFFGVHMYAYVAGLSKNVSYALDTKLCPVMAGLVLSNDAWARIPAQYKPAMLEAVERMRTRLDASLEASDRQYVQNMQAEGVSMLVPTEKEMARWESDFNQDFGRELGLQAKGAAGAPASTTISGAFNIPLYRRIQTFLLAERHPR